MAAHSSMVLVSPLCSMKTDVLRPVFVEPGGVCTANSCFHPDFRRAYKVVVGIWAKCAHSAAVFDVPPMVSMCLSQIRRGVVRASFIGMPLARRLIRVEGAILASIATSVTTSLFIL